MIPAGVFVSGVGGGGWAGLRLGAGGVCFPWCGQGGLSTSAWGGWLRRVAQGGVCAGGVVAGERHIPQAAGQLFQLLICVRRQEPGENQIGFADPFQAGVGHDLCLDPATVTVERHPHSGQTLSTTAGGRLAGAAELSAKGEHGLTQRFADDNSVRLLADALEPPASFGRQTLQFVEVHVQFVGGALPRQPAGAQFRGAEQNGLLFAAEGTHATPGGEDHENGSRRAVGLIPSLTLP